MRSYKKVSAGIKELKDRASEIIALVQRTGRAVSVPRPSDRVKSLTGGPMSGAVALALTVTAGSAQGR